MKLLGTRPARRREHGQTLVLFVLALGLAIIPGTALLLEAGNAYAHQRVAQNAADSLANAGATVLAERLGGAVRLDADVATAMERMRVSNAMDTYTAVYTNVTGDPVAADGTVTTDPNLYVHVGVGPIPAGAQGVRVTGKQAFGTTIAAAIGFNSFTASADATAVAGALTGGQFLPVVIPVSTYNCDGSGTLASDYDKWGMSNPPLIGVPEHPTGQEYIVPLCKTSTHNGGSGSFMFLDLDPTKTCYEEVINPSSVQFNKFPVDVPSDVGADCQKKVSDAIIDGHLQGKVILIPICDASCSTQGGSNATYHIIRIAAFYLDYMAPSNGNANNPDCALTTSPTYGTSLVNIVGGNGSSACIAGWFVRYVTSGPVGSGNINNGEAIGIQLIR